MIISIKNPREVSDRLFLECEYLGFKPESIVSYEVYEIIGDVDERDVLSIFEDQKNEPRLGMPKTLGMAFRFRQVLGQYDQAEDMAKKIIALNLNTDVEVKHSKIIELKGIDESSFLKFKRYVLNPVESVEISFFEDERKNFYDDFDYTKRMPYGIEDLKNINLSEEDLFTILDHYKSINKDPNLLELKILETYWSDHCRHRTFSNIIENLKIDDENVKKSFEKFISDLGKSEFTLMDLATLKAKILKKSGYADDIEVSDEVNACSVEVDVRDGDESKKFLLLFKNETHNHPTEIEPYGGASTCIGGGIRDPLSSRAHVFAGMRISGSKNPNNSYENTLKNKLSQRQIARLSAKGYSDYANQIGLPAGYVREFYDDSFEAKRLELGALLAAVEKKNIKRENPKPGDLVLLLGADTGRDGLGAAVGSSDTMENERFERAGAEVQKGDPLKERNICKLFRDPKLTKLIKKCNDFGAGGVSVAIGELAEGLDIFLDKVSLKYPLNPYEIALSESQERMAVVIAKSDLDEFLELAKKYDVPAEVVANVVEERRMKMFYEGEEVASLDTELLDLGGVPERKNAKVISQKFELKREDELKKILSDVNSASQKGLYEYFDTSIESLNLLNPLGGKYQNTPQNGMAFLFPTKFKTTDAAIMASGYLPKKCADSPYHAAYYALLVSIAKAVSLGAKYKEIRLSLQEYFKKLKTEEDLGLPISALLGAYEVMDEFKIPAIGGKDSMSGSFGDIDVVPSVISFAVAKTDCKRVVSREFKDLNSKILMIEAPRNSSKTVESAKYKEILDLIYRGLCEKKVKAISVVEGYPILDLCEMAFGNKIGFEVSGNLFEESPASFLIETDDEKFFEKYAVKIGITSEKIVIDGTDYDLEELLEIWQRPLEKVYGCGDEIILPSNLSKIDSKAHSVKKALIPIFDGTTGEYDLKRALEKRNIDVTEFIFKSGSHEDFKKCVEEFKEELKKHDLLAFADGAVMGDLPFVGKFIELFIRDLEPEIKDFLTHGKILGIGNSTASLIRAGLFEDELFDKSDIEFLYERHSAYVYSSLKRDDENFGKSYSSVLSTNFLINNVSEDILLSTFKISDRELPDALLSRNMKIMGTITNIEREGEFYKNMLKLNESKLLDLFLGGLN